MSSEQAGERSYLPFLAGGYYLAVNLSQLLRVVERIEEPEPEVFNLSQYLAGKGEKARYYLEILAGGKKRFIAVDEIEPVKDYQLALWLDFPKIMRRRENQAISGFFFDGMKMIALIDFEKFNFGSEK